MKKILITGANSYIGMSFEKYLFEKYPEKYTVDTLNLKNDSWRTKSFTGYDSVFHVAGIAHSDNGRISAEKEKLYRMVNTDLTIETAAKAKADGVRQFIFMSSSIVYGDSAPLGKQKMITRDTPASPANCYGDSKLKAEKGISSLNDENYKVVILRPPMIYGKGSKGNYPTLAKIAQKIPVFPKVDNCRSMLYIDNLCEFVRLMIENEERGIFWPQNGDYTNTSEMVRMIAEAHGKTIRLTKVFNWGLYLIRPFVGLVDKAFGSFSYEKEISRYPDIYNSISLAESIIKTEQLQDMDNNKKNVLMVASVASMIDLFNMENISILESMGYNVHVMANFKKGSITSRERVDRFKDELETRGIKVTHVPIPRSIFKIKSIIMSYKKIKKEVLENKYKIVHCHSPIGGVVCRLACKKARKKGTKVIYTAHGFHFFKGANWKNWLFFYPAERWCAKYTDRLITINKEDFQRASKWRNVNVEYVPGIGVDTEKFNKVDCDRKSIRASFGFKESDLVLMSTGQISVRKNQEIIIRALGIIRNPNVKYLIVGTGELDNNLRNLSKELGVENQVVFAGYREDINLLLHSVDVFVFPSLQEGLPVALMEAMASGLPIICSKIRGNTDLIKDGEGGYLVDSTDVDGFARKIMEMLENKNDLDLIAKINVSKMKKFDISEINQKMKQIYMIVEKEERK